MCKNSSKWREKYFLSLNSVFTRFFLEYFIKILYFSVLFMNYGNFSQFKFWKYFCSFWRKFFSPKIRLFKGLYILNVCFSCNLCQVISNNCNIYHVFSFSCNIFQVFSFRWYLCLVFSFAVILITCLALGVISVLCLDSRYNI